MTSSPSVRWFHRLVDEDPEAEAELGGPQRVASGGLRLIGANALQSAGDQVVNAKTVLPWLLSLLGAPAALVALLVPIRESGSMLPQAALTPWVLRAPRRTRVWMLGASVQGLSVLAMATAALTLTGAVAGVAVLAALAVFAVGRALCSMASKDVQGRTVPKGQRGQVTGIATAVSGVVAVGVGVLLHLLGPDLNAGALAAFLGAAALTWIVGVFVYAGIPEDAPKAGAHRERTPWLRDLIDLVRQDGTFRHFVAARALLLVSALAPPFLVTLAVAQGSSLLAGLGSFVIAQGVASVVGGRVFGRWSDRSSRLVMTYGSVVASLTVLAVVAVVLLDRPGLTVAGLVAGYFVISLVHVGVRVARKTYVIDMAEGDQRTRYVAVANTAMGVILLVTGAISAGLATFGELPALVFLAVLGLVGAAVSWRLPEVSRGA
ncbi:MFS transporter [Ornithinimicrobium sufpigmenti]|uniref:MFS transporter n=1 Tax=Ornithinimicrobium sufpigmenti TaxID=2508882 RepID=UPI0010360710|nr:MULTISPECIES: MFS transporter [unclassified Ornithinimicrobium]